MSIFRFSGLRNQFRAFSRMGLTKFRKVDAPGLRFIKFLGAGAGNGFSIRPDFSTYCILAVWDDADAASSFIRENPLFAEYLSHSSDHVTHFMHNSMSHGQWDGQSPFEKTTIFDPNEPVAVITRATIRFRRLLKFWQYVPSVSKSMDGKPGLKTAIGIGELPLIQQATFSVWEKGSDMMHYAYQSPLHHEVIRKTRELNWYSEELFARFVIVKTWTNVQKSDT